MRYGPNSIPSESVNHLSEVLIDRVLLLVCVHIKYSISPIPRHIVESGLILALILLIIDHLDIAAIGPGTIAIAVVDS